MIMQFDEYGHLMPYEPIPTDLDTFEQVFVAAFPNSTTRTPLFTSYCEFTESLRKLAPNGFVHWINGSFVSRKLNPKDLDVVTLLNYQQLAEAAEQFLELKYRYSRAKIRIDNYFVSVYPESHPLAVLYRHDRAEWLFNFSRTFPMRAHPRRYKGFLEIAY